MWAVDFFIYVSTIDLINTIERIDKFQRINQRLIMPVRAEH